VLSALVRTQSKLTEQDITQLTLGYDSDVYSSEDIKSDIGSDSDNGSDSDAGSDRDSDVGSE